MILNKLLKIKKSKKTKTPDYSLLHLNFIIAFMIVFLGIANLFLNETIALILLYTGLIYLTITLIIAIFKEKLIDIKNLLIFIITILTALIVFCFFNGILFGLVWWKLSIIAFVLMEVIYWLESGKKVKQEKLTLFVLKKKLESLVEAILLIGFINIIWRVLDKLQEFWIYIKDFIQKSAYYLLIALDKFVAIALMLGKIILIIGFVCIVIYIWYKLNEIKYKK